MIDKLWPRFYWLLPARLVYFCAMRVWCEATTGKYENTLATEITASDAIDRFARIHAIKGSGKDEYYDSNRQLKEPSDE